MISIFSPSVAKAYDILHDVSGLSIDDIDSLDKVIFDLEKMVIIGQFIEVPVYIYSDDMVNTLDFSMAINVENLRFESIIDHTEGLQYAAYLNPNDLKLRFTSNSFSPYPVGDFKVVSIRFEVLSPKVYASDFDMMIAYLNGDPCSTTMEGTEFSVATHEVISNEIFLNPNPAHDVIYVKAGESGTLTVYDLQGRAVLDTQRIEGKHSNLVDLHMLPKGSYTVRIVTHDLKVKVQQIILQ